jgi:hypothetical protein
VLQSRCREFYNTGTQRLTQRWQKFVENDGGFVEKFPFNCKRRKNHRHIYVVIIAITFSEKKNWRHYLRIVPRTSLSEYALLNASRTAADDFCAK